MADEFELTPPGRDDTPREIGTADKIAAHRARTLDVMHRRYGIANGATCGACAHLVHRGGARLYPKCAKFRISRSEATDWRVRWPACGTFTPREEAPGAE